MATTYPSPLHCVLLSAPGRDDKLRRELTKHLRPLESAGHLNVWHVGLAPPGVDLGKALTDEVKRAALVIVLVSPDLLALDDNHDDLHLALAYAYGSCKWVLPVLARHCAYGPLKYLTRGIVKHKKAPIAAAVDRDAAWQTVVSAVTDLMVPQDVAAESPTVRSHTCHIPEQVRVRSLEPHEKPVRSRVRAIVLILDAMSNAAPLTLLRAASLFAPYPAPLRVTERAADVGPKVAAKAWAMLEALHLVQRDQTVVRLRGRTHAHVVVAPGDPIQARVDKAVAGWLSDRTRRQLLLEFRNKFDYRGLVNAVNPQTWIVMLRALHSPQVIIDLYYSIQPRLVAYQSRSGETISRDHPLYQTKCAFEAVIHQLATTGDRRCAVQLAKEMTIAAHLLPT